MAVKKKPAKKKATKKKATKRKASRRKGREREATKKKAIKRLREDQAALRELQRRLQLLGEPFFPIGHQCSPLAYSTAEAAGSLSWARLP